MKTLLFKARELFSRVQVVFWVHPKYWYFGILGRWPDHGSFVVYSQRVCLGPVEVRIWDTPPNPRPEVRR